MARRLRSPGTPERDGNLHIHKGGEWVSGTYHDNWHSILRNHASMTDEGKGLHARHRLESRKESENKEQAIVNQYPGYCSRCKGGGKTRIATGEHVWFNPNAEAGSKIRHRGSACDVLNARERLGRADADVPDESTDKEALKQFEGAIAGIAAKFEEDKAELVLRVEAAEQAAKNVEAMVNKTRTVEVVVRDPTKAETTKGKKKKLGIQHEHFERLLRKAANRERVAMKGDPGSGKTRAAREIARILGLPFLHIPIGPQTSKSDLVGFINGAGKYVYSLACKGYEFGGVTLFDEMDAGNAGSLTVTNGMLDSMEAGFANRMVNQHPDFIAMAAMNTYGRGADMIMVGRAQLDGATLNRWFLMDWDTDWMLTKALVKDDAWVDRVQALYDSASRLRLRVTIGMRTAIMGKAAMNGGDTQEEAEHGLIWAPMTPDEKQKILSGVQAQNLENKEVDYVMQ